MMKTGVTTLFRFLCGAALLLLTGYGQPVDPLPPDGFAATAVLSSRALTVGEPVTLTVTVRHPAGSAIRFPSVGSGREIRVQGRSSGIRKLSPEILESHEIYRLTSFRPGDWQVTIDPVACVFPDGSEKMQALPDFSLHVQSSLNEENRSKLSGIKEILKPPMLLSKKLWIPLLIALLALVAALLTLLFIRNRSGASQPLSAPPDPCLIARQALETLRKKPWVPEPFFTELSLILRTYLENRFQLNAPESTTEELALLMARDPRLDDDGQRSLHTFLTQADLVKFARAEAEQEAMHRAFSTVEDFIEQSGPSDAPDKEEKPS